MSLISIVVPCHNEEESLPLFAAELNRVVFDMRQEWNDLSLELILVDDGSTDNTLEAMKAIAESATVKNTAATTFTVCWLSFSRNFGKEAALYAGFEHARGDYVAVMDADLQDPPSLLPEMYTILQENPDCDNVAARRTDRKGEPKVRSFFSRMFYRIANAMTDANMQNGARDFRLMRRPMVDAVLSLGEYNRFSKGMFGWVGFKTQWVSFDNVERAAGKTNWSFFSLLLYAIDGIVAFSTSPLSIASISGILLCFVALIFTVFIVVRALLFGDPVPGWPSLACLITFIGGLQLLCLGVMGQYLAKTYLETKRRPLYIVRRSSEDARDE